MDAIFFGMFFETEKWKLLKCLCHVSCKKKNPKTYIRDKNGGSLLVLPGSVVALHCSVSCESGSVQQLESKQPSISRYTLIMGFCLVWWSQGPKRGRAKGCKVYGSLDSGTHILMVKITWPACLEEVQKETLSGLWMREETWSHYKGRGLLRWKEFVIIKQRITEASPVHFCIPYSTKQIINKCLIDICWSERITEISKSRSDVLLKMDLAFSDTFKGIFFFLWFRRISFHTINVARKILIFIF